VLTGNNLGLGGALSRGGEAGARKWVGVRAHSWYAGRGRRPGFPGRIMQRGIMLACIMLFPRPRNPSATSLGLPSGICATELLAAIL
jgi:hypothetical protein